MALRVCQECTTRFAVGLLACPHCRSTEHYEEGSVMPKITVHGGPSNAAAEVVGAAWSDTHEPDEWPTKGEHGPELTELPAGDAVIGERGPEPWNATKSLAENLAYDQSVDGVDQGEPEVVETVGGPFKPLPEVEDGDTAERVSEPDYDSWTGAQLRAALAERNLSTSGRNAELAERLRAADAEASDG